MARIVLLGIALVVLVAAAPAGASHVSCGDVLTADVRLDSDVLNCPGNGLIVAAPGVTIDLDGHTLEGNGKGAGITNRTGEAFRYDGLRVVNGTVRRFEYGAALELEEESDAASFDAMTFADNPRAGIACGWGGPCNVHASRLRRNGNGVQLSLTGGRVTDSVIAENRGVAVSTSSGVTVERSVIARNGAGISGYEARLTVRENRIVDNAGAGIHADFASEGVVERNLIARNRTGVDIDYASLQIRLNRILASRGNGIRMREGYAEIDRNAIDASGANGILIEDWSRVRVMGSAVSRSSEHGIFLGRTSCAEVKSSTLERNGANGLLVDQGGEGYGECELRIEENAALRNATDGIAVHAYSSEVLVARNRTDRNGDDGIDVDTTVPYLGELEWAPGPLPVFQGEGGVWLVNPDGSGLRRLTDGRWPSWSPDGERIAFTHAGLNVIDADGTGLQKISDRFGFQYAWSPDQSRIAFWGPGVNGTNDLYVARTDGGGTAQITTSPLTQERHPNWYPDGSRLVVTRLVFVPLNSENEDIYLMDPDGTDLTPVTTSPLRDIDPHLSPDGSLIAFLRRTGEVPHNEEWSLFVVRPDGSGERKLADVGTDHGGWDQLSWAPDGTRIAFTRGGDVYTIAPDGSNERRITNTPVEEVDPEWSPDSDALAFRVRDRSGERVQFVTPGGAPLGSSALPNVTLTANHADRNHDLGIEAIAAIDEGGNAARHNGDARQCTGVVCRSGRP